LKLCEKSILKFQNREVKKIQIAGLKIQRFRFNSDYYDFLKVNFKFDKIIKPFKYFTKKKTKVCHLMASLH